MSQLTRPAANAGASAITGGNRTLPFSQIEQAWIQAGGPPQWAATMAAITYFESGGNPSSVQQQCPASESTNGQDGGPCRYQDQGWGLWQITPGDSESQVGTNQALLDPVTNARAAVAKFNSQGIGAWQGDPIGNAAAQNGGPLDSGQISGVFAANGAPTSFLSGATFPTGGGSTTAAQGGGSGGESGCATKKPLFGNKSVLGVTIFPGINACQWKAISGGFIVGAGGLLLLGGAALFVVTGLTGKGVAAPIVSAAVPVARKAQQVAGAPRRRRESRERRANAISRDRSRTVSASSRAVKATTAAKSPVSEVHETPRMTRQQQEQRRRHKASQAERTVAARREDERVNGPL